MTTFLQQGRFSTLPADCKMTTFLQGKQIFHLPVDKRQRSLARQIFHLPKRIFFHQVRFSNSARDVKKTTTFLQASTFLHLASISCIIHLDNLRFDCTIGLEKTTNNILKLKSHRKYGSDHRNEAGNTR
ncbi:hypothetical protein AVEN_235844-1 [Araneus ventricosus]|uniref:Uncharacterized protein n=1 Tax=Araneus ventricosus TaxID=182803 RepID=A0A4Y2C449_ARAVE|nr:hypothetical protein AVEN_235844-1 [Araneus ventricosus]